MSYQICLVINQVMGEVGVAVLVWDYRGVPEQPSQLTPNKHWILWDGD